MGKSKQVQVHQVFDIRYYDGVKMQRILEGLFPERKGSFGLRMTNDQWAFRAPRMNSRRPRFLNLDDAHRQHAGYADCSVAYMASLVGMIRL